MCVLSHLPLTDVKKDFSSKRNSRENTRDIHNECTSFKFANCVPRDELIRFERRCRLMGAWYLWRRWRYSLRDAIAVALKLKERARAPWKHTEIRRADWKETEEKSSGPTELWQLAILTRFSSRSDSLPEIWLRVQERTNHVFNCFLSARLLSWTINIFR